MGSFLVPSNGKWRGSLSPADVSSTSSVVSAHPECFAELEWQVEVRILHKDVRWELIWQNSVLNSTSPWVLRSVGCKLSRWMSQPNLVQLRTCYKDLSKNSFRCRKDTTRWFYWRICKIQMTLKFGSKHACLRDLPCQRGSSNYQIK